MLTIFDRRSGDTNASLSRRSLLKIGALSVGGLTLPDMLRLQANGAAPSGARHKAVISVYLQGGPSHQDMYDLKPDAPSEYRGEFQPIHTNVPGMDICEHLPLQATIGDKLAIIRNFKGGGGHNSDFIMTDSRDPAQRPGIGQTVSYLRGGIKDGMPQFVAVSGRGGGGTAWLGPAHQAFQPSGQAMNNMKLAIPADRLSDRRSLLQSFDRLRSSADATGKMAGVDQFTARALEMVSSSKVRDALDVSLEPEEVRERYGSKNMAWLQARRLAEAGVSFITLRGPGGWDTHRNNFVTLKKQLPEVDRLMYALITDLAERGLADDVAVILWGEFGRTPKINTGAGRDHWPTGFAMISGGGLRMGQVIGATDAIAGKPTTTPYTPSNVLATLYHVLGIDPSATIPDLSGRPRYLLDDRAKIAELV
ncbi:DUF1501 domain-containing protein [Lignipirellula cremea]|uniref:DUF1501 domain-containing protein n=1 Tax=Lignipirellula cremea TaxID=2528010 RepID=A0A518DKV3_9BACT|nr:DUF1501 domain-containing protein [Lignipirellula cremea]QDU92450.1 hypothetical protein Pla8534_01980 [Lignipirellula cremea]